MYLPYINYLSLCVCYFIYSSLYCGDSLCISYCDGSVSSLWFSRVSTSVVLIYSTRSGFSLFIHKAMLPRTLISTDAAPFTMLESHAHALDPPQRPTYLLLGRTLSILVNTKNGGDIYGTWGILLPCILHHTLQVSHLVVGISFGISLAMLHWIWDVLSSPVSAPT